jgi:hypothetical protein
MPCPHGHLKGWPVPSQTCISRSIWPYYREGGTRGDFRPKMALMGRLAGFGSYTLPKIVPEVIFQTAMSTA